ncbi:MAG TPA: GAF domain-containing protein [Thermoanaerobaculia bacterium]|nr:GAF domain-containing protein [Thermoanaerobaculia bacterium]
MSEDVNRRAEKFLELFNKGKEFTEELLRENQRLRYRIASLEGAATGDAPSAASEQELARLKGLLDQLSEENRTVRERYEAVEAENRDFASRYVEVEEQNNNLANLYVASYQLHSTLDFREVIQIVQEIVINLIGSSAFGILLADEKTGELRVIASEGADDLAGLPSLSVKAGEGRIGAVAETGNPYFADDLEGLGKSIEEPIAVVPLKIKQHVIGAIVIYRLLQQKDAFTAVDYELFSLLAAHAATAIFSSKLYSQSERKLNTIQSFLDLLTTT